MKSFLKTSFDMLDGVASKHDAIAVAYSGGKDSLAVLDLCARVGFKRVAAFFMYCVPGLEVCEKWMRFAHERWGVVPVQIPGWSTINSLAEGVYCDSHPDLRATQPLKLKDGYSYGMKSCGCEVMADGMKNSDGLARRLFFSRCRDGGDDFWDRIARPIIHWRKKDVLDYLRLRKIELPPVEPGRVSSGIAPDADCFCWMHDRFPEDFAKVKKWFPYAEAAVKRRDWYFPKTEAEAA